MFRNPTRYTAAGRRVLLPAIVASAVLPGAVYAADSNLQGEITMLMYVLAAMLVFVAISLTLVVFMLLQYILRMKGAGAAAADGQTESEFDLWAWFSGLRPSSSAQVKADTALDHEYDGIRELDNAAPPIFTYILYGTILFAIVYVGVYHVYGNGKPQQNEYIAESKALAAKQEEYQKRTANLVNESNVTLLKEEAVLAEGKTIFVENCASCHGDKAQGNNAPNLTDEYWLHGGGIKNVFKTIKNGVSGKGMAAWGESLTPSEIAKVASYVISIQGTNPGAGLKPQGEKWVEDAAAADTTKQAAATVPAPAEKKL